MHVEHNQYLVERTFKKFLHNQVNLVQVNHNGRCELQKTKRWNLIKLNWLKVHIIRLSVQMQPGYCTCYFYSYTFLPEGFQLICTKKCNKKSFVIHLVLSFYIMNTEQGFKPLRSIVCVFPHSSIFKVFFFYNPWWPICFRTGSKNKRLSFQLHVGI